MEYTYTLNAPADVAPAFLAQWMVDVGATWSHRWHTKHISVESICKAFPDAEPFSAGFSVTYIKLRNSFIRWRTTGANYDVTITYCNGGISDSKRLLQAFPPISPADYIKWFYTGQHGPQSMDVELCGSDPLPEFYPWISDLPKLYTDYINSTANVLLLIGPPGTGKTTFIRGLLRASGMQAWVTYDEVTQKNERLYAQFAAPAGDEEYDDYGNLIPTDDTKEAGRIMVLEDADAMLESRKDGNKLMSRILNLSDGLVSLPARKLVFSTNLPTLASVDIALRRPGRCFAAINFRELEAHEATKACAAIGKTRKFDGPVTLSEALNEQQEFQAEAVRKIGFC